MILYDDSNDKGGNGITLGNIGPEGSGPLFSVRSGPSQNGAEKIEQIMGRHQFNNYG